MELTDKRSLSLAFSHELLGSYVALLEVATPFLDSKGTDVTIAIEPLRNMSDK